MDINSLAKTIFDIHTLYLCLAVYVLTYFIRMLFEGTWKILVQQGEIKKGSLWGRIWGEIVVPILPIVIGGCLGFAAKTFVWPDFAMKTKLARVLYGAICGLFSSFVYNRIRGWLKSKTDGTPVDIGLEAAAESPGLTALGVVDIKDKKSDPPPPAA